MAPSVPTTEPSVLVINSTWTWAPAFADFPARDGWAVTYRLVGPAVKEFSAVNSGSAFLVTVPYGETNLLPGTYTLFGFAELAGSRFPVTKKVVTVIDGAMAEQKGGERTLWCEQMLTIVEAVLVGKASADMLEYNIAGKSVKSHSMDELWKLRASLRQELFKKRTGRSSQVVRVRFGNG